MTVPVVSLCVLKGIVELERRGRQRNKQVLISAASFLWPSKICPAPGIVFQLRVISQLIFQFLFRRVRRNDDRSRDGIVCSQGSGRIPIVCYSYLSATIGSTRMARRAGIQEAAITTPMSSAAANP